VSVCEQLKSERGSNFSYKICVMGYVANTGDIIPCDTVSGLPSNAPCKSYGPGYKLSQLDDFCEGRESEIYNEPARFYCAVKEAVEANDISKCYDSEHYVFIEDIPELKERQATKDAIINGQMCVIMYAYMKKDADACSAVTYPRLKEFCYPSVSGVECSLMIDDDMRTICYAWESMQEETCAEITSSEDESVIARDLCEIVFVYPLF
ncbi:hypothetical protein ACFL96_18215, partial [Thermoproteota archaeon]